MEKTLIVFACLVGFALAQSQQSAQSRCQEQNERYAVPGSCDSYVECINGIASEKQCPDGLRFNPNLDITSYPCQYPNEVTCLERAALQPAQPTDICPHQFGYFRIGDEKDRSEFRRCVNGVGYDFSCPEGLVWSSQSYLCHWSYEVDDDDVESTVV